MVILVDSLDSDIGATPDGVEAKRRWLDYDRTCEACRYTIFAAHSEWAVGTDVPDTPQSTEQGVVYYHDDRRCVTVLISGARLSGERSRDGKE